MRRLLLPFLLPLLLPACALSHATSDEPLDPAAIASLEPGRTTAAEVVARLGAPKQVVELGQRSAWLYEHVAEKQAWAWLILLGLRGVDIQADRCWVFFDEHDILTHAGSTLQAADAEYDVPVF